MLTRAGKPIAVEPQVFDLIGILAEASGDLVTKDTLVDRVWQGLAVSDATINARLSAARKAVGDDGKRQEIIKTIPRRGFLLCAPVNSNDPSPSIQTSVATGTVRFAQSADGAPIAWTSEGSGPPLVRIGHWLSKLDRDRASSIWGPLIERFARDRELIRYDLRGTGLSGRGVALDGVDRYCDDLLSVVNASGHDRVQIFAPSQAVPVALAFAARYPDRVDRMALYGGYVQGRRVRDLAPGELDTDTAIAMIRAGWGVRGSVFMESFVHIFCPDATPEQVQEIAETQKATVDADAAIRLRDAVDRFDVSALLDRVQCPVLVMHNADDAIHPVAQSQLIAQRLTNAQLLVFEGRNHIPLPQTPSWVQMMAAAEAFLDA